MRCGIWIDWPLDVGSLGTVGRSGGVMLSREGNQFTAGLERSDSEAWLGYGEDRRRHVARKGSSETEGAQRPRAVSCIIIAEGGVEWDCCSAAYISCGHRAGLVSLMARWNITVMA
jgi:hypothetical protein